MLHLRRLLPSIGNNVRLLCNESTSNKTFESLLRNSPLMQLGNIENSVLEGTVTMATEKDLYIDFGGKFEAVCRRPRYRGELVNNKNTSVDISCPSYKTGVCSVDEHWNHRSEYHKEKKRKKEKITYLESLFYRICDYVRGSEVLIRLKDFELSSRFLGSDVDLTLLEADAILIGLKDDK